MKLNQVTLEKQYNVVLKSAKMIRKEDNKEINGWVAIANEHCLLGEKDDIVAFGATLLEIIDELNDTPICFAISE